MKEAMFYQPASNGRVRCTLCHHGCLIAPDKRGLCGVRENRAGRLLSLVYGHPAAQAVDPVEKKPLYHFLPGTNIFSIGTRGCNFHCLYCQNCAISQASTDQDFPNPPVEPGQIVSKAAALGCSSIAYTYTEPTIFLEYAYDIALLAREQKLKNIFVTNGYITPEALRYIAPLLDAANIDLKFFRDELYREICGAKLQPVLDMIRLYHELGIWIEITTLVIPGYNDDSQIGQIATFIAAIDKEIPWHISAFFPAYKLTDAIPTPLSTLEMARSLGFDAGLKYIYVGNVNMLSNTRCPSCQAVLVERAGMGMISNYVDRDQCYECGTRIKGIWK